MFKIIIVYFIFSGTIYAQNFENLNFRDTIVLMIDTNHIMDNLIVKINKNKTNQTYTLLLSDEKSLQFLTHDNGIFAKENLKICRKKTQNLKYKMFNLENLIEAGFDNVKHIIVSNKIIIYIVDVKINKKKRVLLKRAYLQHLPKIEM